MQEANFYRSLLPQIIQVYVHMKAHVASGISTWKLAKVETYYKAVKKVFYWNFWVPVDKAISSVRQVGYICVHLCFGKCFVFRPLIVFRFC